jgi:hypothetical protein
MGLGPVCALVRRVDGRTQVARQAKIADLVNVPLGLVVGRRVAGPGRLALAHNLRVAAIYIPGHEPPLAEAC